MRSVKHQNIYVVDQVEVRSQQPSALSKCVRSDLSAGVSQTELMVLVMSEPKRLESRDEDDPCAKSFAGSLDKRI